MLDPLCVHFFLLSTLLRPACSDSISFACPALSRYRLYSRFIAGLSPGHSPRGGRGWQCHARSHPPSGNGLTSRRQSHPGENSQSRWNSHFTNRSSTLRATFYHNFLLYLSRLILEYHLFMWLLSLFSATFTRFLSSCDLLSSSSNQS